MSAPDRWRLPELEMARQVAHGGEGLIRFHRIVDRAGRGAPCHFIDVAELAPGVSVGRHAHASDEEEFYLILAGEGTMWRDGETFAVRAGDLIRNRPGGSHGLVNSGTEPLRIFVFELEARPES